MAAPIGVSPICWSWRSARSSTLMPWPMLPEASNTITSCGVSPVVRLPGQRCLAGVLVSAAAVEPASGLADALASRLVAGEVARSVVAIRCA
jgi:hypothetical protein